MLGLLSVSPLCFPSQLSVLTLSAGVFMHKTVVADLRGEVNQCNVSSRLETVNSGPESAIFQLLSKNMCSRYSYRSFSKSATDHINYMSFIMALKEKKKFFLCSVLYCVRSQWSFAVRILFVFIDI